jgi:hypothetical protein
LWCKPANAGDSKPKEKLTTKVTKDRVIRQSFLWFLTS